ncbi:aldo/keto reductase [Streptosporangium sp. NPDC051023]|uniref:aldo/keto reductase n=1 Tax=Streptosporangium sp. NPDC051023 TaxID=3155410 RepID=UPI003450914C
MNIADMNISKVGFGAWAIGGADWRFSWGATDDSESVAAIHRAVESGVNWIDTAAVYGLGHSEKVVGKALASLTDKPYVFTKAGLVWDPADRGAAPYRSMRQVRREVEDSLRRLGVERIDLYQVHWPDTGTSLSWGGTAEEVLAEPMPLEEYWQVMADLKREGKVRAIGLSNHDTALLEAAERVAHVDAVQPAFSALNRTAAPEVAWAREHGSAVIAYSPMQSGLLTGAFSRERAAALPQDDWRRDHPDFTTGLDANLTVAEVLGRVGARHGVSTASAAVAWALAWPGVSGAIVGARTPDQIGDWAGAGEVRLTPDDLTEVAEVLRRTGAGQGPIAP